MIVSVTPDLALDEGYTYSGGLGILEGDKFYCASKLNIPYRVLSLLYNQGYVDYEFDQEGNPAPRPQNQPKEFLDKLVEDESFTIQLRGGAVKVEALKYKQGSAEAIFLKPLEPEWAHHLTDQLYIEKSTEEKFLKYTLLAKASAEYIRRIVGIDQVDYIDLQESYACILPLILKTPGRYRVIIHTAGPWGHPTFPKSFFEREFGYYFISGEVSLTEIGLAAANEIFAVSAKHFEQMLKIIPHFSDKMRYVTNGVSVERWMDPELKDHYVRGDLQMEHFIDAREGIRRRFIDYIQRYKNIDVKDRLIVGWCRRITGYKRPEFALRAVEEAPSRDVVFILAGKSHPHDSIGLDFMKRFYRLHEEKENVVYIPNYTVKEAKEVLRSIDLLLFTPFYGLEACGTSYMKAAVNGVPTLSTPEGGVVEFIIDGVNGWLLNHLTNSILEPSCATAESYERVEYDMFKTKLHHILDLHKGNPARYYRVSLNALTTFIVRASMERVLSEYYPKVARAYKGGF